MDLVRRKLMLHNGRLPGRFFREDSRLPRPRRRATSSSSPSRSSAAIDELEQTTRWIQSPTSISPDDAAFGCVDFLRAFAADSSRLQLAAHGASGGEAFRSARIRDGKLATASFFATRMLSQVSALLANVRSPAAEPMQLDAMSF